MSDVTTPASRLKKHDLRKKRNRGPITVKSRSEAMGLVRGKKVEGAKIGILSKTFFSLSFYLYLFHSLALHLT